MNIYCKEGTKVKFINKGGYPGDVEKARIFLNTKKSYTVDYVDVGRWISYVYLKEFPGKRFNTVMFEEEENEESVGTLELTQSELIWLSNLMYSETDGTKEGDSLFKKVGILYDEVM